MLSLLYLSSVVARCLSACCAVLLLRCLAVVAHATWRGLPIPQGSSHPCTALHVRCTPNCAHPGGGRPLLLLLLLRAFTLGSARSPTFSCLCFGCCCVSRWIAPPPPLYHFPPRIPPLELKLEPSQPVLYQSGCGQAEETKLHVLCRCAFIWSGGGGGGRCSSPHPMFPPLHKNTTPA